MIGGGSLLAMRRAGPAITLSAIPLLAACAHDAASAAEVRANLSAAGYTLAASSPSDPRAAAFPDVVRSECFAATSAGDTVRVCVWIWPGALPESFPLEDFSQREQALTESRDRCLVVVTPTGDASSPGWRALQHVWH